MPVVPKTLSAAAGRLPPAAPARGCAVVGERVVLPASHAEDEVALREALAVGAHDLGDAAAPHDLADADRRQVALAVVHPGADRRIDREVAVAKQGLALARLGRVGLLQTGGVLVHPSLWPLGQDHPAVALGHRDPLSGRCRRLARRRPILHDPPRPAKPPAPELTRPTLAMRCSDATPQRRAGRRSTVKAKRAGDGSGPAGPTAATVKRCRPGRTR